MELVDPRFQSGVVLDCGLEDHLPEFGAAAEPCQVAPLLSDVAPVRSTRGHELVGDRVRPDPDRHRQRIGVVLVPEAVVGAKVQQRLRRLGLVQECRQVQRRVPGLAAFVDVCAVGDGDRNGIVLAQPYWQADVPLLGGGRRIVGDAPLCGAFRHPVHGRDDRHQADQERKGHPAGPVRHEGRQAAATPEHRREEAAEQEEQWHPEGVDAHQELVEPPVGAGGPVLHRPERGDEGEGGVQADAKQHGEAAQRVEVVPAPRGRGTGLQPGGVHR